MAVDGDEVAFVGVEVASPALTQFGEKLGGGRVDGAAAYVMNATHSVLMSNSIARTAPARCSSSARVRTDSAGPMA